jgi:hypothetical protein
MRLIDRTGQRYERLLVLGRAPKADNPKDTNARWHCKCDCGRLTIAYGGDLARGKVKSCGCFDADQKFKHGLSRSNTHLIWRGMFQRCENPRNTSYKNYGARGITVAPEWRDFAVFIADMGERPSRNHTIERNDNDGPYSKANCRWALMSEQLNNKRTSRILTAFGREQTLGEWAKEYGLNWYTLRGRLDRCGWNLEEALTQSLAPGKALKNR